MYDNEKRTTINLKAEPHFVGDKEEKVDAKNSLQNAKVVIKDKQNEDRPLIESITEVKPCLDVNNSDAAPYIIREHICEETKQDSNRKIDTASKRNSKRQAKDMSKYLNEEIIPYYKTTDPSIPYYNEQIKDNPHYTPNTPNKNTSKAANGKGIRQVIENVQSFHRSHLDKYCPDCKLTKFHGRKCIKLATIEQSADECCSDKEEKVESIVEARRRTAKCVTLRDSQPFDDFEDENVKIRGKKIILNGIKKIIKSIRNWIFRKRIQQRIETKRSNLNKSIIEEIKAESLEVSSEKTLKLKTNQILSVQSNTEVMHSQMSISRPKANPVNSRKMPAVSKQKLAMNLSGNRKKLANIKNTPIVHK
eukprot:TRINITY_DN2472_c0_g1_i4.p1 TRINITY_DN2472_c0_g1~~TRINITY_DN2472_c0_g1_i4.p1  ORF type:complete len:398 (+),score=62.32 TRINITY_DN2472_c0_g1_i4:106-1194(+)